MSATRDADQPAAAPAAPLGALRATGQWCARHWLIVLIAWLAALGGVQGLHSAFGGTYSDDFTLPGTQSDNGLQVLAEHAPGAGGISGTVVLHDAKAPLSQVDSQVTQTVDALQKLPHVLSVSNPLAPPPPSSSSGGSGSASGTGAPPALSQDGKTAYLTVRFTTNPTTFGESYLDGVDAAVQPLRSAGVQVEYGGPLGELARPKAADLTSEAIGFAVAITVLLIGFGSLIAAALPLVTALVAVIVGVACLGLLAAAFIFATVSPTLATMIGLGVGIDYALFLTTRHRQRLMDGADPVAAAGRAAATSGRAVLVSGCTVIIALAGLYVSRVSFIGKLGAAAAVTVVTAVLGALTLVPALFGLIGRRMDRVSVRTPIAEGERVPVNAGAAAGAAAPPADSRPSNVRLVTRADDIADLEERGDLSAAAADRAVAAAPAGAPDSTGAPSGGSKSSGGRHAAKVDSLTRYSESVRRRPWYYLLAGLAIVVVLAIPVFSLRLGHIDDGADPTSFTDKRAFDLISDAFGPGANGPFTIVVDQSSVPSADRAALQQKLQTALTGVPGAASVSAPAPTGDGEILVSTAVADSAPQDAGTTDLFNHLKNTVLPGAVAGTAATTYITGTTGAQVDFLEIMTDRLPEIIAVVVGLAFLIILIVFRGPLVALKAAILNLLSIGASYGVLVAVFQWGWGGPALGVTGTVPIESYVPMIMFAIVFGLSMDYEIFLISRVHEFWVQEGEAHEAVAHGLRVTARVITCAALIMVSVFAAFILSNAIVVKMLGLGLAVSVLIDATVVRLLLVPAVMTLLGSRAWWTPRWLDRIMPHIDTEGAGALQAETAGLAATAPDPAGPHGGRVPAAEAEAERGAGAGAETGTEALSRAGVAGTPSGSGTPAHPSNGSGPDAGQPGSGGSGGSGGTTGSGGSSGSGPTES